MNVKPFLYRIKMSLLLLLFSIAVNSQEVLTLDEAIQSAMAYNYNMQIAANNIEVAENNTQPENTGKLPTVTGNASGTYNYNYQKIDGSDSQSNQTVATSAGVTASYVLYDQYRSILIDQFKENVLLRNLELQQAAENTVSNVINAYYNITFLEQLIRMNQANIEISKRNLQRAEYSLEYGVANSLGVLNNEVNMLNDSLNIQIAQVDYKNAKNELNVLIGRDPNIEFVTSEEIPLIENIVLQNFLDEAEDANIGIQLLDQNMTLDEYTLSLIEHSTSPRISATSGFNATANNYLSETIIFNGFSQDNVKYGLNGGFNAGLSLSWNLYDGGAKSIQAQNAKIAIKNRSLYRAELLRQLNSDIVSQYNLYINALESITLQNKITAVAQTNLEQSLEQHRLGNISTTSLREAQNNLLDANIGLLQAMLQAKFIETQLLQLTGKL